MDVKAVQPIHLHLLLDENHCIPMNGRVKGKYPNKKTYAREEEDKLECMVKVHRIQEFITCLYCPGGKTWHHLALDFVFLVTTQT